MATLHAAASVLPAADSNKQRPAFVGFSRRSTVSAVASWAVDSWRSKGILQIPTYTDQAELDSVLWTLVTYPPLVFPGEARKLEDRLPLQGGDAFRVLLQMAVVLAFGDQMPVIKGDNIADKSFNEKDRGHDPKRLLQAYSPSAGTLNLLRAFATGGYASFQRVTQWNLDFVQHSEKEACSRDTWSLLRELMMPLNLWLLLVGLLTIRS